MKYLFRNHTKLHEKEVSFEKKSKLILFDCFNFKYTHLTVKNEYDNHSNCVFFKLRSLIHRNLIIEKLYKADRIEGLKRNVFTEK